MRSNTPNSQTIVQTALRVNFEMTNVPRHEAWNIGMNLMKSSMQEVRNRGYEICNAIRIVTPEYGSSTDLEDLRDHGNPA